MLVCLFQSYVEEGKCVKVGTCSGGRCRCFGTCKSEHSCS